MTKPEKTTLIHRFADGSHETFLRNYWYPILRSEDLGVEPVGIRRLGEDLVLWRDGAGSTHLFPDACPHRRVQLSLGRIRGDTLECRYHGWQYDGTGQCTLIPTDGPSGSVANTVCTWSYPVEESHGLIWAFMALDRSVEVAALRVPDVLADPQWTGSIEEYPSPVPWPLVMDNLPDLMHAAYLHDESVPDSGFPTEGVMRAVVVEDGVLRSEKVVDGVGQPGGVTIHLPCLVELDFPLPPAGDVYCYQWSVPVDAHNVVTYTSYQMHTPDDAARVAWAKHFDEWGRTAQAQVNTEDNWIIASQGDPDEAWGDSRPAQLDAGIMRLRRMIEEKLQDERTARDSSSMS